MFSNEKAIFRVVPQGMSLPPDAVSGAIQHTPDRPPLAGSMQCPRGCGTSIYWALAYEMAEYKEQFLIFLNQQLCWTACHEHRRFPSLSTLLLENDWTYLPPASTIFTSGPRYANCYE